MSRIQFERRGAALALGTFDGVHLGHQAIIRRVVEDGRRRGLTSVVVTFDRRPAAALGKEGHPALLTPLPKKLSLIEALGVDLCVVLRFTTALSHVPAARFVEEVLAKRLNARRIVVGEGYRFGKARAGGTGLLRRLGVRLGFELRVVKPVHVAGHKVSSTAIRALVRRGALAKAAKFLGRRYSILGEVVEGTGRGRLLGYPTANLDLQSQVLPPRGVYAGTARFGRIQRRALINIGHRPTFGRADRHHVQVEVHMLDFRKNIYGRRVEFEFARRIRPERTFRNPEALSGQLRKDEETARSVLRT